MISRQETGRVINYFLNNSSLFWFIGLPIIIYFIFQLQENLDELNEHIDAIGADKGEQLLEQGKLEQEAEVGEIQKIVDHHLIMDLQKFLHLIYSRGFQGIP